VREKIARVPRLTNQLKVLAGLSILVLIWLPGTLASDLRGLRSNLRLSASERSDARGPNAKAGTNLALLHFAQGEIPAGAAYAVVLGDRWRARRLAAAREAGRSWSQFALAPRTEVGRAAADWLLLLDSSPVRAGVAGARHEWRFGRDWLVQMR
jgi:hypothetical protein